MIPLCLKILLFCIGYAGEEPVASVASNNLPFIALGNVIGNTIIALTLRGSHLQIKYPEK